jgi:myo-inositol-1(or 4)-monophosphatase
MGYGCRLPYIAAEAGARVTDFSNRHFSAYAKEILATNGYIHEEMLKLLRLEGKQ